MTKYWIALTYKPKIDGVRSGRIRQTIRPGRRYKKGDQIAFHGWSKGRYSPWTWRTEYFTLTAVENIVILPDGLMLMGVSGFGFFHEWNSDIVNDLAVMDGIEPATGEELGRVITKLNHIPDTGLLAQILRW